MNTIPVKPIQSDLLIELQHAENKVIKYASELESVCLSSDATFITRLNKLKVARKQLADAKQNWIGNLG